ncbi:hypothetical protein PsorP6_015417 [Peronosclerospora sorghi]|uniref:Uncharacterized protein n=1 Tax=Peronosclerospora sorghi TaxID=230839 RepID=A0ACC0WNU9_9STRA|nr:hypothetical protein PsorP6_015417 [Peronosclerospora sorghi]
MVEVNSRGNAWVFDREHRSQERAPLLKAEKAFENAFAIAILPIPQYSKLQALVICSSVKIKMFTGTWFCIGNC